MAVDLARYIVSLEAQTAQYVQQLDKANKKLDSFHRDQTRALSKVKEAFIGFGRGIVAALSFQAVARFTAESIRMADAIGKTAKAAGITAEELQRLRFAFSELGGVTQQQTDVGLQRFNRSLGLAVNGSREAVDSFNALRVAVRNANGSVVGTEDALNNTLKALAAISDDSVRAARAAKIFGEELGPKLAGALKGGVGELEKAKAAITGLLSDRTVKDAERLSDAFGRLSLSIGTTLRSAVIDTAADLSVLLGLLDRGSTGQLERDLELVTQRIKALQDAQKAGSLGGNQILLDRALEEQARLQRQLRLEQQKTPFSERQQRFRNEQQGEQFQFPAEIITQDELIALETFIYDLNQAPKAVGMLTPEMEAVIESIKEADKVTKSMNTEVEQQLERWRETKQLFDEGWIDKATLERVWDEILKPIEDIPEKLKPIKAETDQFTRDLGQGFKSAFADWLVDGEFKFKDFLKRLAAQFAASQIFDLLGSIGTSGTGGVAKFLGKVFGGFKADGGSVSSGRAYVVGERGPEMFVPGVSGTIVPNGGAGARVTVNNNIDARGATTDLAQALPGILEQNRAATVATILKVLGQPRMA